MDRSQPSHRGNSPLVRTDSRLGSFAVSESVMSGRLPSLLARALVVLGLALPAFAQPTLPAAASAQAEPEHQPAVPGARGRPVDMTAGSTRAAAVRLERPSGSEISQRMTPPGKGVPLQVAFGRETPAARTSALLHGLLAWETAANGNHVAAVDFTSVGSAGLRIGLRVQAIPTDAVVRFFAPGDSTGFEATGEEILDTIGRNLEAGEHGVDARTYWSPLVESETVRVEFELPPGDVGDRLQVSIPEISHFVTNSREGFVVEKASSSCQIDVMCNIATWGTESDAVARMLYQSGGSGYLCTGSLVADQDTSTSIPYFLSANHCISTQSAASTLQTFWRYRSTGCNQGPGSATTVTGGAVLLYNTSATDTSFMKLNNPPPAGAMYAGWSVGTSNPLNTPITGIHHPQGDLQKISFGSVFSYYNCFPTGPGEFGCDTASIGTGGFIGVIWSSGLTEPGSSGSGLFRNSGHYLLGQLYGGTSECGVSVGPDMYGRFDVAYNDGLSQYLAAAPSTQSLSVIKAGAGSGTVTSSPAGISCGATCFASFATGTAVTLTAAPTAGSTFTGWSGACSGTGTCAITLNANATVTATFTSSAQAPGAPENLAAAPGNGQATFTFSPPSDTGGSGITNYTVSCSGGLMASSPFSPITMTGMTNGVTYTCSATATNATTTGPPSNSVQVTPAVPPFGLTGVVSRKSHGGVTFNLPIDTTKPVTGAITVDPRVDGSHKVVFQFNDRIIWTGAITVSDAGGTPIGSSAVSISTNDVILTLSGVDDRRVRIAIAGVNGVVDVEASIGFLGGDVDMSGAITATDLLREKGRMGQGLGASNFLYDINLDVFLNNNDLLTIQTQAGKALQ